VRTWVEPGSVKVSGEMPRSTGCNARRQGSFDCVTASLARSCYCAQDDKPLGMTNKNGEPKLP
jgi:hypothetical protein